MIKTLPGNIILILSLFKTSKTVGLLAKLRHFVPGKFYLKFQINHLYYIWTCCLGPRSKDTSQQNSIAIKKTSLGDRRYHAMPFFIDANVLPLNFLYYDQTMTYNLMHDVYNNKVPSGILNLFQKTNSCLSYNTLITRASASGNLYVNSSNLSLPRRHSKGFVTQSFLFPRGKRNDCVTNP